MADDDKLPALPLTGYKLVKLPDGRAALATLNIPKDAVLARTGYRVNHNTQQGVAGGSGRALLRTNKCLVVRIVPLDRPTDVAMASTSYRDPMTRYLLGKYTEGHCDTKAAKGPGLHFFLDAADAKQWHMLFHK